MAAVGNATLAQDQNAINNRTALIRRRIDDDVSLSCGPDLCRIVPPPICLGLRRHHGRREARTCDGSVPPPPLLSPQRYHQQARLTH